MYLSSRRDISTEGLDDTESQSNLSLRGKGLKLIRDWLKDKIRAETSARTNLLRGFLGTR